MAAGVLLKSDRPTVTERVIEQLEALGYTEVRVYGAKGFWRTQDVYRWEGYGYTSAGLKCIFSSWDTLTKCARYGVNLVPNERWHEQIDVHAKEPG